MYHTVDGSKNCLRCKKNVVYRYRYNGISTINLNWWGISEPSTVGFGLGCKKVAEKSENWNQFSTVKRHMKEQYIVN